MDTNPAARRGNTAASDPGSDLERLVRLEDRITGDLARTEEEAAAMMDEARRAVRGAGEIEAGLIEKEMAALRERMDSEFRRAIEKIEEEARRQVERFDGVTGERLARLALRVVERITAMAPSGRWPEDDRRGNDDHQDVQGADPGSARQAP